MYSNDVGSKSSSLSPKFIPKTTFFERAMGDGAFPISLWEEGGGGSCNFLDSSFVNVTTIFKTFLNGWWNSSVSICYTIPHTVISIVN